MNNKKNFRNYTINADQATLTVEEYLKDILQYSSRKRQLLTRNKGIYLNRKPTFMKRTLKENDILRIMEFSDNSYGVIPQNQPITVLYEDAQVIVLDKPPRQLVHPTSQTNTHTLANFLAYYFQSQNIITTIRPLHRLDRDTSGCVLFAKNAHSQTRLTTQLNNRVLKRTYLAVTDGIPACESATINQPIAIHPSLPNRRMISPNGETAITHYQTREIFSNHSLLELSLETGRTHQIRVHLSAIGTPIVGDAMYGKHSPFITRQALHAASLQFNDLKSDRVITVNAPLPLDMQELITRIK